MPHLYFLNRHWRIAGDELFLPAIFAITFRALLSSLIIYLSYFFQTDYESMDSLSVYILISLLINLSSIMCEINLFFKSLQGTIIESEKRTCIPNLLIIRSFLAILNLLCAVFGLSINLIHSAILDSKLLNTQHWIKLLIYFILAMQISEIFLFFCCGFMLSIDKFDREFEYNEESDENFLNHKNIWEERCRSLCKSLQICSCNCFGDNQSMNESFEQIARVLTKLFHHDGFLNVVPSDVVAGICFRMLHCLKLIFAFTLQVAIV
jgi:hypothetical protein